MRKQEHTKKARNFDEPLPIHAYPVGKVHLEINSQNGKDTFVAIKHTVKEFPYIKNMQSYRHKDDFDLPQRPASDVFPFAKQTLSEE